MTMKKDKYKTTRRSIALPIAMALTFLLVGLPNHFYAFSQFDGPGNGNSSDEKIGGESRGAYASLQHLLMDYPTQIKNENLALKYFYVERPKEDSTWGENPFGVIQSIVSVTVKFDGIACTDKLKNWPATYWNIFEKECNYTIESNSEHQKMELALRTSWQPLIYQHQTRELDFDDFPPVELARIDVVTTKNKFYITIMMSPHFFCYHLNTYDSEYCLDGFYSPGLTAWLDDLLFMKRQVRMSSDLKERLTGRYFLRKSEDWIYAKESKSDIKKP